MRFVHIVAILAVAQFIFFTVQVGQARGRHGVKAPAITGHEEYERALRVQMNTLEQLACFLPVLFIAAVYWPGLYVAAIGVVYLVGRMLYWRAYMSDPTTRGPGFLLTAIPTFVLLVASLLGVLFGTQEL